MKESKFLLDYNVRVLELLGLSVTKSKKQHLKDCAVGIFIAPLTISLAAGLMFDFSDSVKDTATENIIALVCIMGMFYMHACYIKNRRKIQLLINGLYAFKKFDALSLLVENDKKIKFFSRIMFLYGIAGNISYALMPFVDFDECERTKSSFMITHHMPCGVTITRTPMPFRVDQSPFLQIWAIYQSLVCIIVSIVILACTLLVCGILLHIKILLECLKEQIESMSNQDLPIKLKQCIQFHIEIIEYSKKTNEAFTSMMFLYNTLTSLVISVLGYKVLVISSYSDSIRYGLHLGGWLILLLLVCYHGQYLMNSSLDISNAVWSINWYQMKNELQRTILIMLMRAQKPLKITPFNLGVMSLGTFLQVMKNAYSFFTLLVNMRSKS